jgi:protein TonB
MYKFLNLVFTFAIVCVPTNDFVMRLECVACGDTSDGVGNIQVFLISNRMKTLFLFLTFACFVNDTQAQKTHKIHQGSEMPCYIEEISGFDSAGTFIYHGDYKKTGNRASTQGQIIAFGKYKRGQKNGYWKVNFSQGAYKNGVKVGIWVYKNEKGQIEQKYDHSSNELLFNLPSNQFYDWQALEDSTKKISFLPIFIGGESEMFLSAADCAPHYPKEAVANRISGTVVIEVTITKNGEIQNEKVLSGIGFGCDEEALRCAKGIANQFIPAQIDGKNIDVKCKIKYQFKLA